MKTFKEAMAEATREEYFKEMFGRDRIFCFLDENQIFRGMATYVFTDNPEALRRTDVWSTPEEHIGGRYIFIDKLVIEKDGGLRQGATALMRFLKNKYPDKKVLWHSRRGGHEKIQINRT